jgi:hypothetical protein
MPKGVYPHKSPSLKARRKMSKARKGKHLSLKTRRKMSKNNCRYWKGKHLPEKTKRKMRAAASHPKGEKSPFYKGGRKATKARERAFRRKLGGITLNTAFKGSEGHHIDRQHIVFIPKELHRSVPHRLNKPETMEKINTKVLNFLGVAPK